MVSSGSVNEAAQTLESIIQQYNSGVTSTNDIWQGASGDSLRSQATDFASSYVSTLTSQLTNFANAITAYNEYTRAKTNLDLANSNLRIAKNNSDNVAIRNYSAEVQNYTTVINTKKAEITELLSAASSKTLDKSSSISSVGGSALSGQSPLGSFTNYYQYNYSQPYSEGTIATSGCGPTSAAMVLSYLKGQEITPVETAAFGNGTYTCSQGTYWSYFGDIADKYGVNCIEQSVTRENIINGLNGDNPVIMSMGPGTFTSSGHFIVLRDIDENGQVTVADPNSESRSNQTYDINVFLNEGKEMWAYSV